MENMLFLWTFTNAFIISDMSVPYTMREYELYTLILRAAAFVSSVTVPFIVAYLNNRNKTSNKNSQH